MSIEPTISEILAHQSLWNLLSEEEQILSREIQLGLRKGYIDSSLRGIVEKPKRKKKTVYYSNKEWAAARKHVFARDGYHCYVCNATATQIDHLLPKSKYPELALNLENLKPICWNCNKSKQTKVDETFLKKFNMPLR